MQRLSTIRLRATAQLRFPYQSSSIPIHLRIQAKSRPAAAGGPPTSFATPATTVPASLAANGGKFASTKSSSSSSSSSSSPIEAEKASAETGGSRSKDFAEAAAEAQHSSVAEHPDTNTDADAHMDPDTAGIDSLAERDARGRTGGGEPLESSSENAPPKPKISNASVPGEGGYELTEEQQREVDEHNREFEKRYGRASPAADDKVNKRFWKGGAGKEEVGTK